jgi:hypothetical protein
MKTVLRPRRRSAPASVRRTSQRRLFLESLEERSLLAAFTPGNLVVYRIGDGIEALSNTTGNAVFLDEITPTGTLVQSIALPTTRDGANRQLIAQGGTGQLEGAFTRSVDGRYLVLTGYANDIGGPLGGTATTLGNSTSANVNRVVGRVDAAGNIDTTTAITNFGTNAIRTAVSVDGSAFWVAGQGGVRYIPYGGSTVTTLVSANEVRQLAIVDGQLYRTNGNSNATTPSSLAAVGTGLPTTTGQTITPLPGLPTSDSDTEVFAPHSFFFADLSPDIPGVDVVYIVDSVSSTGGIHKFSFDGTTWVNNGRIATTSNYRSLTGVVTGDTVTLYSSRTWDRVIRITDTGGYNAAPVGTISTALYTGPTNTLLRGIAFAPDDGIGEIGGLGGATNYASGAAATLFASTATFSDMSNLAGGSLTIGYASGGMSGDNLAIADGNGIVADGGVVTFQGTQIATYPTSGPGSGLDNNSLAFTFNPNGSANPVTSEAVQALLRQVTFATSAASGNRVLNLAITQNDGQTSTATQTINVNAGGPAQPPVNTVPTTPVLATEDVPVAFTDGISIKVEDADSASLTTIVSVPGTNVGTFTANHGGGAAVVTGSGTPSITFTGSPAQVNLALATLVFTPAPNRNTPADGPTVITVATSDGSLNDSDTITIILTDVNDAPVAAPDSLGVLGVQGGPAITIAAATLLQNDHAGAENESSQSLTITGVGSPVGGTVSLSGTTITFTPAPNFSGTASFQYTITDDGLSGGMLSPQSGTGTVTFTISDVNDPPIAVDDVLTNIAEDSGVRTIPFSTLIANDSPGPGEASQTLTIIDVDSAVGGTVGISGTNVLFTPALNYFGPASFRYVVQDNGLPPLTTTAVVSFTITPVNDDPTISDIPDQNIGMGGSTSPLPFTVGDIETAVSALTVTATSSNALLVPNNPANLVIAGSGANRTITVIPAPGQSGSTTITVTVSDGASTTSDTFVVNVAANAAPTISDVSDQTIAEDTSLAPVAFTVNDAETAPASLVVTATSSDQAIIPDSAIVIESTGGGGRTVAINPAANVYGSVTITLAVTDGVGQIAIDTFTLTITEVNDPPTAANDSLSSIAEDSGVRTIPFSDLLGNDSQGPANESNQALTITSVTPISGGTVAISGTNVLFTPAADFHGNASFSYTVQDNGTTNGAAAPLTATANVSFTILPVNDPPSFTKGSDITVHLNSPAQSFANWATGISPGPTDESGQTVMFDITGNTNDAIFAAPPSIAPDGTLTFTPQPGASGSATITVVARDNGGTANGGNDSSVPQTFVITVLPTPANELPTIDPIDNLLVMAGVAIPIVQLTGISAGGTEKQALFVTATSDKPALISNPTVGYTSPGATGTLTFSPAAAEGNVTITVTVRDAGPDGTPNNSDDAWTTTQFTITVIPYNAPPDAIAATRTTVLNTPISGELLATDEDSPNLTFSITAPPVLGALTAFNPTTGEFTYTPSPGVTGLDLLQFSVTDGSSTDTATVRIVILGGTPTITYADGDLVIIGTPDADSVIVSSGGGNTVRVRTQFATTLHPAGNRIVISTGDSDDLITVSGLMIPTLIDGGAGDDRISSGMQNDVIAGGLGNDRINASGGNNVVWGDNFDEPDSPFGGDDVLSSLTGSDVLFGGGGNDELYPGDGDDYVHGGAGNDIVGGGNGNDRIYGGDGNDRIYGDAGDDILHGGTGVDTIVGRTGNDLIIGGTGADSIQGSEGDDLIMGGDLTFGSSSSVGDAADTALLSLLYQWSSYRTAGLLSSLRAPNDNAVDKLNGYTGDDDLYVENDDVLEDFGWPFFGTDRRY